MASSMSTYKNDIAVQQKAQETYFATESVAGRVSFLGRRVKCFGAGAFCSVSSIERTISRVCGLSKSSALICFFSLTQEATLLGFLELNVYVIGFEQ